MQPKKNINTEVLRLALTSGSLLWSLLAQAAPSADNLFELSLEQLGKIRITTATLTDKSINTVPASVTVFTHEQIKRLGVRRLEELLNYVPGYQAYDADSSGYVHSFSSRGRRIGSTAREVLVLLDGHRLNNDWSGSMISSTLTPSLENVDRIEIIRGAGSAIYGSNAELGVINIITKSHTGISAEAGNNDRHQLTAQWNHSSNTISTEAFARANHDGGQSLKIFDPNTQSTIASDDSYYEHELYARGKYNEFDIATRWTDAKGWNKYSLGYASEPGLPAIEQNRSAYVDAGWAHQLDSGVSIAVRSYFNYTSWFSDIALTTSRYAEAAIREHEHGANIVLQKSSEHQNWLAGAEYRNPVRYEGQSLLTAVNVGQTIRVSSVPEDQNYINGLFGQYEYIFSDTNSLIAGGRQDHYADWGDHFSPRAGWVHRINNTNTLKLLYTEAFRAPSAVETKARSDVFVANPDLLPETVKTGELVWLFKSDHRFISSTLYSGEIKDAITEIPLTGGLRGFANTEQSISGLEVEWIETLQPNWSIRSALTHQFDQPTKRNSESANLLSGAVTYSLQKWSATMGAYYADERQDSIDTDNNASTQEFHLMGGHTIAMAHLSWAIEPKIELYLHGDNLLNREYVNPANRFVNSEGSPGRAREISVGIRWTGE